MRFRLAAAAALLVCALAPARNADWDKRRGDILAAMQSVMGPLPPSPAKPPDVTVIDEIKLDGFTRRKISFDSGDGDAVPAYLFIPNRKHARGPAVLCLHQTTKIGKDEPAGIGGKENLHYARELAERGFVTLAPDYPGFGDNHADAYSMGYASATMKGIRNHRRAVDLLVSMPEVDPRRIGAIGHSLGGHNALFLAAFEPRIAAVATSCGFTSVHKYKGGDLTGWSHRGYMPRIATEYGKSADRIPFDFPDILAVIAPRPVFVNAPVFDSNFDWSGVDDCVRLARAEYARAEHARAEHARAGHVPWKLRVVHPDSEHDFPPAVRTQAYQFLARALR